MNLRILCLFASVSLLIANTSFAQKQRETETRTGTVKEVIHKGRARILVVTCDGEEMKFPVTSKVNIEVTLTGGSGAQFQKGTFLEGTGTFTNNKLFLESAKLRILASASKVPESKLETPKEFQSGQSLNSRHISGLIMARQPNKDYPEYEELALKPAPNVPTIMFKPDIAVSIVSNDIDQVQPDQPVEIEYIEGRNDKRTLVRASVEGGEYTPPDEENSKKKN